MAVLIQELVERSVFEQIRLVLVDMGYTPDITIAPYNVGTPAERLAAWNAGLANIVATKGFAIELFGHGDYQERGEKRVPRIVINPGKVSPGDLGSVFGGEIINSVQSPGNFEAVQYPYDTSNLVLEINIVGSNAKQNRILNYILAQALGERKFIPLYDDPEQKFFIEKTGYYQLPNPVEGIHEVSYNFEVKDLYVGEIIKLRDIVKITRITVDYHVGDPPPGESVSDGSQVIE